MTTACPDTVSIVRAAKSSDGMGGAVYNWTAGQTTVVSSLACNIQNASPREMETFARRGIEVSHKVFVPSGVSTRLGDRILDPNTSQYLVVTFISDMGGEHEVYKIYANLVQ